MDDVGLSRKEEAFRRYTRTWMLCAMLYGWDTLDATKAVQHFFRQGAKACLR